MATREHCLDHQPGPGEIVRIHRVETHRLRFVMPEAGQRDLQGLSAHAARRKVGVVARMVHGGLHAGAYAGETP